MNVKRLRILNLQKQLKIWVVSTLPARKNPKLLISKRSLRQKKHKMKRKIIEKSARKIDERTNKINKTLTKNPQPMVPKLKEPSEKTSPNMNFLLTPTKAKTKEFLTTKLAATIRSILAKL